MALSLNNYIYVVQKVGEPMELSSDYRPETCSTLGLDCGTCVHAAAASVAKVCHGLETHGVQQIFFQLYPSPGCHPMADIFAMAYQESLKSQKPRLAFATAAA